MSKTCRCSMCGAKNAGKLGRGAYIKAGVRCNENLWSAPSRIRKQMRRQRRINEKRQWKKDWH